MLELKNFQKSFGSKPVLELTSQVFRPGLHWLRGQNGSGKSTLFRCIAGISPFRGNINLDGFDAVKNPESYRFRVSYSEAEPRFPGFLSGREMLEFVAESRKAPENQLDEISSALGLSLYYDNPSSTYSSGMSKKVSLAMAFLGKPSFILLDEPFITLDLESMQVLSELISKGRETGVSFLVSSHPDFQKSGFRADFIWNLNKGILSESE